jgi:hypothetical protein
MHVDEMLVLLATFPGQDPVVETLKTGAGLWQAQPSPLPSKEKHIFLFSA